MKLTGTLWFVVSVAVSLLRKETAGLTCLSGTDVAIPRDHNYVRHCGANEKCYIDAFSTNGVIKYNIGCRDSQLCTSTGQRASFCHTCCSTDLCNNAGCGASGFQPRPNRGPVCYSCAQQRSPELCDRISVCGSNSVCKVKLMHHSTSGDVYYTSGCEIKQTCQQDVAFSSVLIGRKRYSQQLLLASNQCLIKCCDSDLCSRSCGSSISSRTTASNPCLSNPCAFGTCHVHGHSYTCQCQTGYSGAKCDQVNLPGGCPVGWRKHGHSCYLIDKYKTGTWDQANAECHRYGAYLAEVNSASENAFLLQASTGSLGGDWWIGGSDKTSEGQWRWSHSNGLIQTQSPYWGHHRPNNLVSHSGEDEDCLEYKEDLQAWNDEHCSREHDNYICERPA